MQISTALYKLRTNAKLTQAQFSEIVGVSQQSVQKWESGLSTPDLDKIVLISKHFGVSLDSLVLGHDSRTTEEIAVAQGVKPQYQNLQDWDFYASDLLIEYQQSIDEGLDIERYKELFSSVATLPNSEYKKKFADVLYELVTSAKQKDGYPYTEPSTLEEIKKLRKPSSPLRPYDKKTLEEKVHGAWMGRICGCLLGKILEGIRSDEYIPFLKQSGNYPLHRYVYRSDVNEEMINKCRFPFKSRHYVDDMDGMYPDDDMNYVVIAQELIQNYGRDFTPNDVAQVWLSSQSKNAYWTAERVAYCNFLKGYTPPQSAIYKNPYREFIGAQIRGDYFGYINPGNPELAAEMAFRDASVSHTKNGIYGEMFAAAMLSVAATTNNLEEIILGGLSQIPSTSRLYKSVMSIVNDFKAGKTQTECFDRIHTEYDEYTDYGWCHTIPNAMIVAAALLYGKGDYAKSICMAVETAFDTDCNGATVGSVLGMANGLQTIPEYWTNPINDTLHTTIFGLDTVKVSDRVKLTMEHIAKK